MSGQCAVCMMVKAGDIAPDFEQDTLNGSIRFHEWIGRSWCLLFSMSDMASASRLGAEWSRRGVKLVGLSTGAAAPEASEGLKFPVVADGDCTVSRLYGGLPAGAVFLIDPDKRVRLARTYPPDRCDFNELLRLLDGLDGHA